ncbi:MAG: acyltransferase [Verrucomicrobiota bacterium]|jgi:peptidoglycan/LPS O-acetylase OafA/YrhL
MSSSAAPTPTKHWLDAWHVNPSANRDYDFIDGLRGVAILMVVACHHFYVNPKSGPATLFVGAIIESGGQGVQLFFALSGFLISWPFWKRKFAHSAVAVPPGYGRRRFWKIYPPLALSLVLLTPFYILLKDDWSYLPLAAKWLAGIPFIFPVIGKLNPVMWTLVIEVQFYAVLPFIFLALKWASPKLCLWLVTLAFLLVPLSVQILAGWHPTFHPDINSYFPSGLDSFCLGVLLAGLDNMGVVKKSWAKLGIIGACLWPLASLGMAWIVTHTINESLFINQILVWVEKIASACLLCYIANPQHSVARMLCSPVLRWFGIISYEWYLIHQPITLWVRDIFGPANGSFVKYAIIVGGSFIFSLAVAGVVYRHYSLPILKFGRTTK